MAPTIRTFPDHLEPFGTPGTVFGGFVVPAVPLPWSTEYEYNDESLSDALMWAMTRTVFDGVTAAEGTSRGGTAYPQLSGYPGDSVNDRVIFRFPPDHVTTVEKGFLLGLRTAISATNRPVWSDGFAFPTINAHAWANIELDLNGGVLWQRDDTAYEAGIRNRKANCTLGTTTVTLTQSIQPEDLDRLVGGLASIQSEVLGAGKLFAGTVKGTPILGADATRKILTVGAGTILRDSTLNENVVVYLPPIAPEHNGGVKTFTIEGPGAWNGVERAGMNVNIIISNGTIRGSNSTGHGSGIETGREEWIGVFPHCVDGLLLDESLVIENTWSDALYLSPSAQVGIDDDVAVQCDNVTMKAKCVSNGRHFITCQGSTHLRVTRSAGKNTERLAFDCETTSVDARWLDTIVAETVISPGTAVVHISPAALSSEPPFLLDGIGTTTGSDRVSMPTGLVDENDMGSLIDHPGLPAGSYIVRRMSPTELEVSQEATDTLTDDALMYDSVLLRGLEFRKVGNYTGTGNMPFNNSTPNSRAYFSYRTTAGSPIATDIVFEDRLDAHTFTTADLLGRPSQWGQTGLFSGQQQQASAVTATTATYPGNAAKSTVADKVLDVTVVEGNRTIVVPNGIFANNVDKWHSVTDTLGLLRDGTFVRRIGNNSRALVLSRPPRESGATTITVSGKARGYISAVDDPSFTDFVVEECRKLNDTPLWGGGGVIPNPPNKGLIMVPGRVNPEEVTIRRNFFLGERQQPGNVVARYGVSRFTNPGTSYDMTGSTIEDNWFYDMVDNQVLTPPTTTVDLVMTVEDDHNEQPVFTIVGTRSDDESLDGHHGVMIRDGVDIGPFIFDGDTAIYSAKDFSGPLGDGTHHTFQARWGNSYGGSWDSLGALSNIIDIDVGDPVTVPTSTVLEASPDTDEDAGTTIHLVATVDPVPGVGIVRFTVDAAIIEDVAIEVDGTAELDVTLVAGTHVVMAQWRGNDGFDASFDTVTLTALAVDVDPPTVVAVDPADLLTDVSVDTDVSVTWSEDVTEETIDLRVGSTIGPLVLASTTGTGTDRTVHPIEPLELFTTYYVVAANALDGSGNRQVDPHVTSFTTELPEVEPEDVVLSNVRFFTQRAKQGRLRVSVTVPGRD